MIETRAVMKAFGQRAVLRGVDLAVAPGDLVTLIGPNGAGKTTLLRILATLMRPTGGEVRIGGHLLPRAADQARQALGVVLHQTLLYDQLSAEENLRFYGRLYGVRDLETRVGRVLEMVNLTGRRADAARTFSRGQQQRLALARALIHDPAVLLLDEPYTGLDPQSAAALDALLQGFVAEGRSVLMTIHDLARGLALSNRVAILARGKIAHTLDSRAVTYDELLALYAESTAPVVRAKERDAVKPAAVTPGAVSA